MRCVFGNGGAESIRLLVKHKMYPFQTKDGFESQIKSQRVLRLFVSVKIRRMFWHGGGIGQMSCRTQDLPISDPGWDHGRMKAKYNFHGCSKTLRQ